MPICDQVLCLGDRPKIYGLIFVFLYFIIYSKIAFVDGRVLCSLALQESILVLIFKQKYPLHIAKFLDIS